ncbi:RNA-directed DNA polymerase (reverse transcriptase)-related family protein [Rhynchospora pubera]|uniref:RNA-directed DNA polymerase (Reverse transcriptase)-related family protein n=1 Tax=Rhynchospora pubera TaxID=906938 RepID=A0AAV8GRW7_9POAL|nr:RNA-directed DNA polymerase (reverse transcriptase)-related family protein [Rhynchospora pubera]
MDILTRMLEHDRILGHIQGLKLAINAPPLTSIMFADDLIIFGQATAQEVMHIQRILHIFCGCSGQQIGHEKSRIWFSRSTPENTRRCIAAMLNAVPGDDSQIYLGVPVVASRPAHFNRLVDKVQGKLNSWSAKLLSQAGKVVLIKSVIEPMVLYGIAGGPLPDSTVQKLNQKIRSFFWGCNGSRRMQLLSWGVITKPKMKGGLGLRDISVINGAAVMKILWRLASKEHEEKLWVRILKAKYLSRRTLWTAAGASGGTKLWKAVIAMRETLKPNLIWQLGRGDKCLVFGEPWFEFWQQYAAQNSQQRKMLVRDLIDGSTNTWRTQDLISCFGFHGALFIACKYPEPPGRTDRSDRLIFKPAHNGKFSFKGAVRLLMGATDSTDQRDTTILKAIWHSQGLIPRVRLFLWKLFHDSIPTQGTYARKLRRDMPPCQLCDNEEESGVHALFKCPSARTFWLASRLGLQSDALPDDPKHLIQFITSTLHQGMFATFANHMWALWKHRCGVVHEERNFNAFSALRIANSYDALSNVVMRHIGHLPCTASQDSGAASSDKEEVQCWVDGSCDDQGEGGWAFVLFDQNTLKLYGAGSGKISSPFHGELNAVLLAVRAVQLEGIQRCVFHSDCQVLCNLLNGKVDVDAIPWQCFFEAQDAVNIFRDDGFTCVFCPRSVNVQAHCIANYARRNRIDIQGFTFPLPCVTGCT